MRAQAFYLMKKTGSYADATAALGLGKLMRLLTERETTVRDRGPYFEVDLPEAVDLEALDYGRLATNPGYRFILLPKEKTPPPESEALCINYEQERAILERWREARRQARGAAATAGEDGPAEEAPRPDWYLLQNLNSLQAFGSYNGLHAAIRAADPRAFSRSVAAKLQALAEGRDAAGVETPFRFTPSPVQAFNPGVGKGVNRPKPDGAQVGNLPGKFADWFEEWLRYIGVHLACNAYRLDKDIKFVALVPADVAVSRMESSIREAHLKVRTSMSPTQIDVQNVLEMARRLILDSGHLEGQGRGFLAGRTPRDVVAGIHTAYFRSLGQGKALTNTSFVGLPGWFPVVDRESAEAWLAILDEHQQLARELDEVRSEEATLLMLYRDFLSASNVPGFLEFASSYAAHVMRARDRKRRAYQLSTVNVRRLIESMDDAYLPILESEGFRNVAGAIRRATVNEQFLKARHQQEFEIRYGLFQELKRASSFKDQLVTALSRFVNAYNTENARRSEQMGRAGRKGRTRPQVTTEDLRQVMGLIDRHGPEVVGMLLVAYGSARDPREPEAAAADKNPA